MKKTLFETAFERGVKVREKKSGVVAEVIDAFGDGELYLDEGTSGISPVSVYDANDFEIVKEGKTMNIAKLNVGGSLDIVEIESLALEDMQNMVGGYIERLGLGADVDVWLNDIGKLIGLPINFGLAVNDEVVDVICGDVFFAGINHDTGETIGLTEAQINWLKQKFNGTYCAISIDSGEIFPVVEYNPYDTL